MITIRISMVLAGSQTLGSSKRLLVMEKLAMAEQTLKTSREESKMEIKSVDAVARHRPSKQFDLYRTIDQPPPPKSNTSHATFRPRYSFKIRQNTMKCEPPETLKQYKWRAPKQPYNSPEDPMNTSKKSKKRTGVGPLLPTQEGARPQ
ncbi:hypothetical protein BGZ76_009985 [Entomortierella beljakovae]|nr:hypothetical protein BGZ76_009985 [Entomortierella beljakovae]